MTKLIKNIEFFGKTIKDRSCCIEMNRPTESPKEEKQFQEELEEEFKKHIMIKKLDINFLNPEAIASKINEIIDFLTQFERDKKIK